MKCLLNNVDEDTEQRHLLLTGYVILFVLIELRSIFISLID